VSSTPEPTLRELYATARACDAVAEAHGFVVHPLVTPADVPDRGLPPRLYKNADSRAVLFWVVGYPERRQLSFGETATEAGSAWGAGDAPSLDALLAAHDAETPDLRAHALRSEAGRRSSTSGAGGSPAPAAPLPALDRKNREKKSSRRWTRTAATDPQKRNGRR
jgi:hypothetical protein